MRKNAIFALIAALYTFSLGCQSTPETEYVLNRSEQSYGQATKNTDVQEYAQETEEPIDLSKYSDFPEKTEEQFLSNGLWQTIIPNFIKY